MSPQHACRRALPRPVHPPHALLAALPAVAALACNPEVPIPHRRTSPPADEPDGGIDVTLEPPAPLDAAPRVLRLHVTSSGSDLDPERVVLVDGRIGPAQLRQIQKGEISKRLSERIVPSAVFREEEGAVVVAPMKPLTQDGIFTLASGEPATGIELRVAKTDAVPLLERIWPPKGASATARLGVFCGDEPLPAIDEPAQLAPDGPSGRLRRGIVDGDPGQRCLRFEANPDATSDQAGGIPPPAMGQPDPWARLDPRPLTADAPPWPIEPLACAADEAPFGPGCVRVADDRLYGRSPKAPVLWSISTAGIERTFAALPAEPFVIAMLSPSTSITMDVVALDNRGDALRATFSATTLPPMPHVILNEVLANPLGPEPQQEWVELFNDGLAPAELEGYVLSDVGGETPLPQAVLPPGAYALIVNDTFDESGEYDPAPAPDTLILRVPKLGTGGLSNEGEALKLLDANKATVSRFPAGPKPKPGMSLARRSPSAPDGLASSFLPSPPTPGQANSF